MPESMCPNCGAKLERASGDETQTALCPQCSAVPPPAEGLNATQYSQPSTAARAARRRRRASVDFLLVAVMVAIVLVILWPALTRKKETTRLAACQNNLKHVGLALKMFEGANGSAYPKLADEKGQLIFANENIGPKVLYPDFISDPYVLICPEAPHPDLKSIASDHPDPKQFITDQDYIYLGFVVTNDSELESFATAYRDRITKDLPFDTDLDVPPGKGTCGGAKILRLHVGIEKILITDANDPKGVAKAQATIPVMWDRCRRDPGTRTSTWFTHQRGQDKPGANVLFMDGHVEFVKYPGKFPVTEEACRILDELYKLKFDSDGAK